MGSQAVIQRADGKLCSKKGGDLGGKKTGERKAENDKGIYSDRLSGCFVFGCAGRSALSTNVCVIKQGAYVRSPLVCSLSLLVSVSDLL